MLGHDREQRLGVADARDDLVAGILEQPCEPFAEQHRVLGDHESHGIATSMRVPPPRGLAITSVPPWAETRSSSPASPEPRRARAPPMPSSATHTLSEPVLARRASARPATRMRA